jgi:cation transport ATPase
MDFERRMSTVKKTYRIEVDCANCANLMEEAANRTEGVQKAVVNFMTQKMIVEFAEGSDEKAVMKEVVRACKRVEEDCEIYL